MHLLRSLPIVEPPQYSIVETQRLLGSRIYLFPHLSKFVCDRNVLEESILVIVPEDVSAMDKRSLDQGKLRAGQTVNLNVALF